MLTCHNNVSIANGTLINYDTKIEGWGQRGRGFVTQVQKAKGRVAPKKGERVAKNPKIW